MRFCALANDDSKKLALKGYSPMIVAGSISGTIYKNLAFNPIGMLRFISYITLSMAFAGWFLSRNTTWFNLRPRSLQDLQIVFNLYANSLGPDFIVCAKALSRSHRFLSIVSLISSPLMPSLEID